MRNLHVYGGRFCNEKYTGNWLCWVNKIQINVHTGIYTVLICNILIHLHLRSVFSITKSLYLTHKSLISLLNNIYWYLIYKKLVWDINEINVSTTWLSDDDHKNQEMYMYILYIIFQWFKGNPRFYLSISLFDIKIKINSYCSFF